MLKLGQNGQLFVIALHGWNGCQRPVFHRLNGGQRSVFHRVERGPETGFSQIERGPETGFYVIGVMRGNSIAAEQAQSIICSYMFKVELIIRF